MYNYEIEKKNITAKLYKQVKSNALNSTASLLKFNDFTKNIGCYESWEILACIDKLIEEGFLKCTNRNGWRQNWEYRICI